MRLYRSPSNRPNPAVIDGIRKIAGYDRGYDGVFEPSWLQRTI